MTYELRNRGYEIETGRSGAPEIKGYSQEYLDGSSPRSQQIRKHLEKLGRNSPEAAQIAAHATRDSKQLLSPEEVLSAHRQMAAELGKQPRGLAQGMNWRTALAWSGKELFCPQLLRWSVTLRRMRSSVLFDRAGTEAGDATKGATQLPCTHSVRQ